MFSEGKGIIKIWTGVLGEKIMESLLKFRNDKRPEGPRGDRKKKVGGKIKYGVQKGARGTRGH